MRDEIKQFDVINMFQLHRPSIERGLKRTGDCYDAAHVLYYILSGNFPFWADEEAYVITNIEEFPKKKFLNIFMAGGSRDAIYRFEPQVMQFAKAAGCVGMTAFARRGWPLGELSDGWKATQTKMIKEF